MPKTKTSFFCQNCGTQTSQWMGQCKACGEWNTIVEEIIDKGEEKKPWKTPSPLGRAGVGLQNIKDVSENGETSIKSRNEELNRD